MEIKHESDSDHTQFLEENGLNFQGKKVLDLGCRTGELCEYTLRKGAKKALGVDVENLKKNDAWEFHCLNLNQVHWEKSFELRSFDFIFAFDIIEHLDSPYLFLQSCYSLLSPGGIIVISTPNINSWERVSRPHDWSGIQDPQHKIIFALYSLEHLLKVLDYKEIKIKAPIRKLPFLCKFGINLGGQIQCIAQKIS